MSTIFKSYMHNCTPSNSSFPPTLPSTLLTGSIDTESINKNNFTLKLLISTVRWQSEESSNNTEIEGTYTILIQCQGYNSLEVPSLKVTLLRVPGHIKILQKYPNFHPINETIKSCV